MAQNHMVLFARKISFESRWNELFLKNGGIVTPEMSVLGDEIKKIIREILANQESPKNPRDGEIHLYAG
ncbi:MAG: hypothetical protein VW810_00005 [Pelagibacteraceae bacterium]